MNIKSYLKSVHVTQLELAEKLSLSRPTLDAYIQQFEQNEQIARGKYQLCFEQLFGIPLKTECDFKKTLESVELYIKQEQSFQSEEIFTKENTILSLVTNSIQKDLSKPDADFNTYVFINLIIQNYRKNKSIQFIINYILALYARKETSTMSDDDRIMLSNLHLLLSGEKPIKFKKESFDKLIEACKLYSNKKSDIKKRIQNQLLDELSTKIQILTEAGVEINSDEFELLYKT